jgi:hypothetical protein
LISVPVRRCGSRRRPYGHVVGTLGCGLGTPHPPAGHTPATVLDTVRQTSKNTLEVARNTPPDTVGPGWAGALIRLDEFIATRVLETLIHGLDLTDALGRPPLAMPKATPIVAELLDEIVARMAVPGRPADLVGDDLAFIRAAAGRGDHPDPRLPVVG